ncbi:hypothetical protein Nepgr_002831 [Nepenthes gracilis]|uniref:Uncharacterized protein n=1 Tax=Nepenthes gracilis TaxID=150966 RepID=A0AAD3RXB6_NEPGR|nr:hypothetical protein Nepgr_002831 [Nepenthes gracilis]
MLKLAHGGLRCGEQMLLMIHGLMDSATVKTNVFIAFQPIWSLAEMLQVPSRVADAAVSLVDPLGVGLLTFAGTQHTQ